MDDLKSDMDFDIDALLEQGKIKTEALTKRLEFSTPQLASCVYVFIFSLVSQYIGVTIGFN